MRWSWPIGRLAGIPLRVHLTFPLLLAWIAFAQWRLDGDLRGAASLVLTVLIVFGIVVLHELGHALAARRYGVTTRDITLLPIGGVARLERIPKDPKQELIIALAGPAVNVALALLIGGALLATGGLGSLADLGGLVEADPSFDLRRLATRLVGINAWLVAFNLLPAFPMDGGRVLRAALAMHYGDHARATDAAAQVGRVFALLFGLVGVFVVNSPLLVLIAVFVWISGSGEAAQVRAQAALAGVTLRAVTITDLRTLTPDSTLAQAAQLVIDGFQHDFPVLDGARYVGMLSRTDLVRGLHAHGADARVQTVMRSDVPVLDATLSPERALQALAASRATAIPVVEDGRLVGLLTQENVMEYLMLRQAAQGVQ
jgi:Zn-dependent protease/CBS domain-containing protein